MDKSFLQNIKDKQYVAAGKQVTSVLSHRVMETLASRKVDIARSMGVPVKESVDEGSSIDGDDGVGKNIHEEEDLKDIPESKKSFKNFTENKKE